MALVFVHQDGIYNSNADAIRFFAVDGNDSVTFTISREAVVDLEQSEGGLTEAQLLEAFDKHLKRIRQMAEAVYRSEEPKSSGAYVLTSADFFPTSK